MAHKSIRAMMVVATGLNWMLLHDRKTAGKSKLYLFAETENVIGRRRHPPATGNSNQPAFLTNASITRQCVFTECDVPPFVAPATKGGDVGFTMQLVRKAGCSPGKFGAEVFVRMERPGLIQRQCGFPRPQFLNVSAAVKPSGFIRAHLVSTTGNQ